MGLLTFLLKIFICSSVLYGYYLLLLRNKRFHRYNRFYLISTVFLSLAFPFVNIEVVLTGKSEYAKVVEVFQTFSVNDWDHSDNIEGIVEGTSTGLTIAIAAYTVVGVGLMTAFIRSINYIKGLSRKYRHKRIGDLRLFDTNEPGTPFSFFKNIYWNASIPFNSSKGQQVFRHEMFHVQERHTVDSVFMQIVCIICWFNPVFFIIKKELKAIHEFLADQYAISDSDRYAYAEMLVFESIRLQDSSIAHPFYNNQIKRRIAMITKLSQNKYGYWSRIMILPVTMLLFCVVAVKAQQSSLPNPDQPSLTITSNANTGETVIMPEGIPSSVKTQIIRFFNRNLRYPAEALQNNHEGIVYFSVNIDEKAQLSDFKVYDKKPETGNGFYQEIVVVGYGSVDLPEKQNNVVEAGQNSLRMEVERVVKAYTPVETTEKINAQKLHFAIKWLVQKSETPQDEVTKTFVKAEKMPAYPGGPAEWNKFIQQNAQYPEKAKERKIAGSALVQFVIGINGEISDITLINGNTILGEEALRLVKASGKWNPAIQNGKAVRCYSKQEIEFDLASGKVRPVPPKVVLKANR